LTTTIAVGPAGPWLNSSAEREFSVEVNEAFGHRTATHPANHTHHPNQPNAKNQRPPPDKPLSYQGWLRDTTVLTPPWASFCASKTTLGLMIVT
jgi:hypothetical protein